MKKLILGVLALLCMVSTASAEVKEYGESYARYAVDVPDGWKAIQENEKTVSFTSPDKAATVVVAVDDGYRLSDAEFDAFVRNDSEKHGFTDVRSTGHGLYTARGTRDGIEYLQYFIRRDEVLVRMVLAGNLDVAGAFADTIDFRN